MKYLLAFAVLMTVLSALLVPASLTAKKPRLHGPATLPMNWQTDETSEPIADVSDTERWDFGGAINSTANWSSWNGYTGSSNLSYSLPTPEDQASQATIPKQFAEEPNITYSDGTDCVLIPVD